LDISISDNSDSSTASVDPIIDLWQLIVSRNFN
jgi:hypothetical protein